MIEYAKSQLNPELGKKTLNFYYCFSQLYILGSKKNITVYECITCFSYAITMDRKNSIRIFSHHFHERKNKRDSRGVPKYYVFKNALYLKN